MNSTLGNKNAITLALNDSFSINIFFFKLGTKFLGDISILITDYKYVTAFG